MIAAIEAALQHDVAGDPITGIRWTRRTTEKIATELATLDIQVCPRTVARILKDLDYRLRVNHKRVSAGSGPDRDQQFQYIAEQRMKFAQRGLPIVSIDTKKRELVGNFKNPGTVWGQTGTDNEHRLARAEVELGVAVYRAGEGFGQRGNLAVDARRGLERSPGRDRSQLAHAAVCGLPHQPALRAHVVVAGATVAARTTAQQRFNAYQIALAEMSHASTNGGHGSGQLVTGNDAGSRRELAAIEVQIGATDAHAGHGNLNLTGAGIGNRPFAHGQLACLCPTYRFHHARHAVLLRSRL